MPNMQVLAVRQPEMQVLSCAPQAMPRQPIWRIRLVDGDLASMQRGDGVLLGQLVARRAGCGRSVTR